MEEEVVEDGSPRGIWSGIFGPGKPRDVGGDARRCWAAVLPAQDRDQARVEAETETETEAEAEAEAEAETEAAMSPRGARAPRRLGGCGAGAPDARRASWLRWSAAPGDGRRSRGAEDLGRVRGDPRLHGGCEHDRSAVRAARGRTPARLGVCAGGTASKKVKINDVLLATTYVVMVPARGRAARGSRSSNGWTR